MKQQMLNEITRRDFLQKISALPFGVIAGLEVITQGCAAPIVNPSVWDNKPRNPNYQGSVKTFYETARPGQVGTPGVEYICVNGTPMVAAADGRFVNWRGVGRGSGEVVELVHRLEPTGRDTPFFNTIYGHISVDEQIKKVNKYDIIRRGTVLGYVHYHGSAKLMTYEAFDLYHSYWVDPENYGPGYTQLDYWDGRTNPKNDNYAEKFNRQINTLKAFIKTYKPNDLMYLLDIPRSIPDRMGLFPSVIAKWRAMENLYQKQPEKFSASKEEIEQLKNEFYANQPVILTLPLKKLG